MSKDDFKLFKIKYKILEETHKKVESFLRKFKWLIGLIY